MPIFEFNEQYYSKTYKIFGSYTRENRFTIFNQTEHILFKNVLQPQPGDTILIIGAGFGWLAEEWTNMGLGPICAVDTSPWIQANKITQSAIPIYDLDITTSQGKDQAKSILGVGTNDKIKWAITEDVTPCLADSECLELATHLRTIAETVVHYITIPGNYEKFAPHNGKTAQEWKNLLTPDLIAPLDGKCNII